QVGRGCKAQAVLVALQAEVELERADSHQQLPEVAEGVIRARVRPEQVGETLAADPIAGPGQVTQQEVALVGAEHVPTTAEPGPRNAGELKVRDRLAARDVKWLDHAILSSPMRVARR